MQRIERLTPNRVSHFIRRSHEVSDALCRFTPELSVPENIQRFQCVRKKDQLDQLVLLKEKHELCHGCQVVCEPPGFV